MSSRYGDAQMTPLLELLLLVQEICTPLGKCLSFCCRHVWHTERPSQRGYCRCGRLIRSFCSFWDPCYPYFWCLSAVTPSRQTGSCSTRLAEARDKEQHTAVALEARHMGPARSATRLNQQQYHVARGYISHNAPFQTRTALSLQPLPSYYCVLFESPV